MKENKLLRAAAARLRSRGGDSIAEVLVALLISAVALVMLASMISASASLIERSKATMAQYYAVNNALTLQADGDDALAEVKEGSAVFKDKDDTPVLNVAVFYRANEQVKAHPVFAYWKKVTTP